MDMSIILKSTHQLQCESVIMNKTVELIVAMTDDHIIGNDNKLIWHLPLDLKNFKFLTSGNTVVMGWKTWESLPASVRPLPDRTNVVITRNVDYVADGATVVGSIEEALEKTSGKVFVIGGGEIYKLALPYADFIHVTHVRTPFIGDTVFPQFTADLVVSSDIMEHDGITYQFCTYRAIK